MAHSGSLLKGPVIRIAATERFPNGSARRRPGTLRACENISPSPSCYVMMGIGGMSDERDTAGAAPEPGVAGASTDGSGESAAAGSPCSGGLGLRVRFGFVAAVRGDSSRRGRAGASGDRSGFLCFSTPASSRSSIQPMASSSDMQPGNAGSVPSRRNGCSVGQARPTGSRPLIASSSQRAAAAWSPAVGSIAGRLGSRAHGA